MRILFITNYHQLYGANRSLLPIIERYKNTGHEVCLFLSGKGDLSKELVNKHINHNIIPFFSQLFYYRKKLSYLAVPLLDLWTLLLLPYMIFKAKHFRPDLIYSNTSAENIGIIIARFIGVKHLTHVREFMDLDYQRSFIFGAEAKKKFICMSDAVIYVSHSVAKHILKTSQLPKNQAVIYDGVKYYFKQVETKKIPKEINLGVVGILDVFKGQDKAIRYFKKVKEVFPNAKLHVWGDREGAYKNMLFRLINELELQESVIMHGFEKNAEVIYNDMHALLMCSLCEGFGRVTVEAMMRGIPVIGYNSGGTAEIVKNGISGYIFSNEDDFLEGIKQMFSSDERYNMLCQNAYKESMERFTEERYVNDVVSFVNSFMVSNANQ